MTDYKAIAADIDLPTHVLIDGERRPIINGKTFDTIDLAAGKMLAALPACDAVDVDAAVVSASAAFESGR